MAETIYINNSFKGGWITPRLAGRSDLEYYFNSCNRLENATLYPHGGATKRPGTKYVATAADSDHPVRVIPFKFSNEQTYIIEMSHQKLRFFMDGGIIVVASGSETPYEIDSPFNGNDLFDINFNQTADTIFFAHKDYYPQRLIRFDHNLWSISDVPFNPMPHLDWNIDDSITITASALTGDITLTASENLFVDTQVGTQYFIRDDQVNTQTIGAENIFTDAIEVDSGDEFIIRLSGDWEATVSLQRSYDEGANYIEFATYTSNTSIEYTEVENNVFYRIGVKIGNFTSGSVSAAIVKKNVVGYADITGYVSETVVSGTVLIPFPTTSGTSNWSEGAWSEYRGFPSCFTFHKQRSIYGGTEYQPQTFWGSQVDDYVNFDPGTTLASEGFSFTIDAEDVNTLQWFFPSRVLLAGTASSEWKLSSVDQTITPTTPAVDRQTSYGSAKLNAIQANYNILFVQSGNHKIRSMRYNYEIDGYVSDEISARAEHLLSEYKIVDWAFAKKPDSILYIVLDSGDIITCTYDPSQEIVAFAKIADGCNFKSVAVIPNEQYDEVWVVVERVINGSTYKYIEQFNQPYWREQTEYIFMDSSLSYDGAPKTTLSGLEHLEGREVSILVDGAVHPNRTVVSGTIELQSGYEGVGEVAIVHVGIPYTTYVQTMRLAPQCDIGVAHGKRQVIYDVAIDFLETFNVKLGSDEDHLTDLGRMTYPIMSQAPTPFTGRYVDPYPEGWENEQYIMVVSDSPAPFTILGIASTVVATNR